MLNRRLVARGKAGTALSGCINAADRPERSRRLPLVEGGASHVGQATFGAAASGFSTIAGSSNSDRPATALSIAVRARRGAVAAGLGESPSEIHAKRLPSIQVKKA
jgi:hypothetical protein